MRKNVIAIIIKIISSLILSVIFLFVCFNSELFGTYASCGFLIILGIAITILLYDAMNEIVIYNEIKRIRKKEEEKAKW